MSLFPELINPQENLLPRDGTVNYYGKVFSAEECGLYYNYLLAEIPWKNDEAVIFGRVIETKRQVCWLAEKEFEYTYSGRTKRAGIFNGKLLTLKTRCEQITGDTFNSCLLNLYHDGSEGMAWHSDAEKDLKKHGTIASLTFGAERKFVFKHKTSKEKVEVYLEDGGLLVMKDETQDYWLHRLPPTKRVSSPRINLTFRTIIEK